MKKVKEERTQMTDKMNQLLKKIDFNDTFSTINHQNSIEEITNFIFNTTPVWIESLFQLRNKMAGLIGLKTEKPADYNEDFKVGGYVKFFKIYSIAKNEVVLGADDKHLNFRVILTNEDKELYNCKVITLVKYNNRKGKIYMGIIKPFHRIIVKRMVRNAYREEKS
ncbi:DUF2867 domain-containing protein [Crocinitomix catalasitica]|uniref:DUF2867 domain-containing protein n=1 Tax=Crocinitomix catalasitica TaxID=184607 RepID=UPI000489558C|nr:DUF2867 domain-containing protein [Crocinitomix catalasitica]